MIDLVDLVGRDAGALERRPDRVAPSWVAGTSLNGPPKLPTGVRTALTITASSIVSSSISLSEHIPVDQRPTTRASPARGSRFARAHSSMRKPSFMETW